MGDPNPEEHRSTVEELSSELARQKKIIAALMNRVERTSASSAASEFDAFQTTITLEQEVRRRTAELELALQDNQRMTRALRESEARFRSVVDQPLVGIAIVERGLISFSNAKFSEMFGWSPQEVIGAEFARIACEKDRQKIKEQICFRTDVREPVVGYRFAGEKKTGVIVEIELHGSVMQLGERHCLIAILMDVTDRVKAEQENQALYDLLREQSVRDSLTGLFNRRYLDTVLDQGISRADRTSGTVSVVLCDIDHFKSVNDTYGHLAGDEVLRVFASIISKACRHSDIACRYGGEEFLVIMPGAAEVSAMERAEHFRARIAQTAFSYEGSSVEITASFGVATFPCHGLGAVEVLAAADRALYKAKDTGRNKVVGAGELGNVISRPASLCRRAPI